MIDILRQHIISWLGNDMDNLDTVLHCFTPLQIERNEFLVHQGAVCKYVYFIASGCLQVFVYDNDMNSVLVSGFLICKADGLKEVQEWSKTCPILKYPNSSVEIRPLVPFPTN